MESQVLVPGLKKSHDKLQSSYFGSVGAWKAVSNGVIYNDLNICQSFSAHKVDTGSETEAEVVLVQSYISTFHSSETLLVRDSFQCSRWHIHLGGLRDLGRAPGTPQKQLCPAAR